MSHSAILGANLAALAARQPEFRAFAVEDCVREVDGCWRLLTSEQPRGVALHSRDPHREADRVAGELLSSDPPDVLVVVGLCLGFLVDALERRGWRGKVLALEPTPHTVQPLLARRHWQSWIDEDRLRVYDARDDFAGALTCWPWFDGDARCLTYVAPVIARLRPEAVERARHVLARLRFNAEANANARRQFAAPYLLNTLRNVGALAAEGRITDLAQAAQGLPAVVVAAGPSLDRALPALRAVQHTAVIIAVDTTLRALLDAGVCPHAVVAVDPGEANARHLTDLPACNATALVCEGSLDPLAVASFQGRTFFFAVANHHPWPWLRDHGYAGGTLRAWGSVLNSAYDLALRLDCNPIAFVGADLAFTEDRPYARGLTYELDWQRRAAWGPSIEEQWSAALNIHPPVMEPDVAGGEVRTAAHLVAFRDWLVGQIGREPRRRFINATGGGVLQGNGIEQVVPEMLPAVLRAKCTIPADVILRHHRPAVDRSLVDAAQSLLHSTQGGDPASEVVFEAWQQFAPAVDRRSIAHALAFALDGRGNRSDAATSPAARQDARGFLLVQEQWLRSLIEGLSLATLSIPPHRLERADSGARVFRYRTAAGRLVSCVLHLVEGAVFEDGRPLRPVWSLDEVTPGTYSVCRDEVHFRATDDSDPRWNGRTYAVVTAPWVAELEQLPLIQILSRHL